MFAAATSSLAHRVFSPRAFARPPRGPDPRPNPIRQSPRKATTPRMARLPNAAADRTTTETVASAADVSALLLVGFHPDEIQPLTELVGSIAAELDLAQEIGVALVNRKSLNKTFASLLDEDEDEEDEEEDEEEEDEEEGGENDASYAADGMDDWDDEDLDASFDGYEVHPGDWSPDDDDDDDDDDSLPPLSNILPPAARCVLLRGDGAKALMPHLRWEMQSAGFEPAIFGAFTANNQDATIAKVASNVVEAHERHWRLSGDPGSDANVQEPTSPYAETPSSKALWATNTAWEGEEAWSPASAVPVLNVVTDAATVPDPPPFGVGDYFREDATAIVALDGVVGESLRGALLDAVTEPGWDHATAASPPTPKWDRSTTDGINGTTEEDSEGDSEDGSEDGSDGIRTGSYGTFRPAPGSWGLTESALEDVVSHPATAAFLSRIAALYPEYHVRTMPADALEPDGVPGASPDSSGRRIATAVANAAVYGDDFKWHLDADPAALPPSSPFAERYGTYVNRSVGRPLFVSALVYLNAAGWTADMNAETLVLDPGTGTGVFVRPTPGRVLLMDQDALHRVSTPSQGAGVPRYSLVLKLCFYPKHPEARPRLSRPEWGRPVNFGTARGLSSPFADDGESRA